MDLPILTTPYLSTTTSTLPGVPPLKGGLNPAGKGLVSALSGKERKARCWMVMQVGTGRVNGWYANHEDAIGVKDLFDIEYPDHFHRVLEARVDVPWFPLSAAKNDLLSPGVD